MGGESASSMTEGSGTLSEREAAEEVRVRKEFDEWRRTVRSLQHWREGVRFVAVGGNSSKRSVETWDCASHV